MRDPSTFEARLRDALDRYSEAVLVDRDRAEIVRMATVNSRFPVTWWRGLLDVPRLVPIPLVALLVLTILAAMLVVGSQLLRPPAIVIGPTPSPSSALDATRTSFVIGQTPSPISVLDATRTSLLGMSATVLADGRVLFVSAGNSPTTWDPSTGRLTASGDHPTWPEAAYEPSPAILLRDGRVLTFGASLEASLYDPTVGHFEQTGSMNSTHQSCHCGVAFYALARTGAVLLHDGRVFVSGGTGQPELYDPAAGTFTLASQSIPCGQARGPVALLRDGTVLVTCLEPGGRSGAAIYHPATDAYTAAGSRTTTNAGAATVLNDGRVLVTGQGLRASLGPAEIYDPATDTFRRLSTSTNPNPFNAVLPLSDGRVLFLGQEPVAGGAVPGESVLFDPISETFVPVDPPVRGESPIQLLDGRVLVLRHGTIQLFDPTKWQ